jgi:hypothetical protein
MMRRLGLFALIFIVLAALYWLVERPADNRSSQQPERVLSAFEPASITRINITCPDKGSIVLQRADTLWQVSAPDNDASHTADSTAVQTLLDALAALTTGSIVSRNSERHALFEVSPDTGLRIDMLESSGTVTGIVIGKNGPNIFSTYVRAADKDEVYLVDGILQGAASKTLNEWRDKSVFKLDPGLVRTYTLSGDRSLTLRKSDDTWQSDTGESIDAEATAQAVRTFAGLSAADFAEGSLEDFGLAPPSRIITAELADGTRAALLLGSNANAFQQYAKIEDGDTVYIVEKYLLDSLCPAPEQMKAPETAPAPE